MPRPWQMALLKRVDRSLGKPLYQQIAHALIHEIQRGRLIHGAFLPSTRELSATLGVNRKTIVLAYEELIAQGWLESRGTRGTVVAISLPTIDRRHVADSTEPVLPRDITAGYRFREPSSTATKTWSLKLDEGSPDGRLFPPDLLARAYRGAIQRATGENRLLYGDPRGSHLLREALAVMLRTQRGVMTSADNICITRGSQMAVFLAARVLLRPGDVVLVEALSYQPAMAAFRECGARIMSIPTDAGGLDVDEVARQCRHHRVRAIFLTPHHQFPTTVALQPDRRLRLLDLARRFSIALIEDDYDHEFHFESQPLLPMASYAPKQVIYVGSMSKMLLPALRIGYLVAPRAVVNALADQVMLLDGMGNTLTEDAVADLIRDGEVRRHVRKVTQIYARRRVAFARALREELGDIAEFDMPDGGLAFWLRFRDQALLDRIETRAPELALWLASSHSYLAKPGVARGLRLGFASLNEDEARDGIRRLREAATTP